MSTNTTTTVSVRLTTDFDAFLGLVRLDGVASCPETTVALGINVGDNNYVISSEVLQPGDYSIYVSSVTAGDPSLFCPTPGNYTLTLIDGPISEVKVTSASVSTTDNQMFDKSTSN